MSAPVITASAFLHADGQTLSQPVERLTERGIETALASVVAEATGKGIDLAHENLLGVDLIADGKEYECTFAFRGFNPPPFLARQVAGTAMTLIEELAKRAIYLYPLHGPRLS